MTIYQEGMFHDRQGIGTSDPETTTSTTFVDVTGAFLTTKDLSQPASYLIVTPVLLSASSNNTTASFRATLDGTPVGNTGTIIIKVKDLDIGYTFVGLLDDVNAGEVLQLQFATSQGTLTIIEYAIIIDGIPTSKVIV